MNMAEFIIANDVHWDNANTAVGEHGAQLSLLFGFQEQVQLIVVEQPVSRARRRIGLLYPQDADIARKGFDHFCEITPFVGKGHLDFEGIVDHMQGGDNHALRPSRAKDALAELIIVCLDIDIRSQAHLGQQHAGHALHKKDDSFHNDAMHLFIGLGLQVEGEQT